MFTVCFGERNDEFVNYYLLFNILILFIIVLFYS